ncbi:MAG: EamA family transporter [Geodermatophilaceae bacterium]|jgi:drug/metabolite transporter (DMT)-like permease|nr:EamA family transporter [Geodermatophilaceae bacterium]
MGITLALAAALAYGLSDFLGGLLSRRISPWTVALLAQFVGAATVSVAATTVPANLSTPDVVWGAASGIGSGMGTVFLYRGLGGGQMNVVAPLSALGAAVVPVVVGVALGERPAVLTWIGIGCALPAIWLVSRAGTEVATQAGRPGAGVRDGLLAGAGFGLLFVALGQVPEEAGLWPLAIGQTVALIVIAVGARIVTAPIRSAGPRLLAAAGAVGLCAAAATVLYQLAARSQLVSVAAVLTSLYPALTVALAAVFLSERMNRTQACGLGLAAAAVVLVALP